MAAPSRPSLIVHHVLVVDDDFELADLLVEVLTLENWTPDYASNGIEALDKLRTGHYKAVICDLMMPRMDGETFYKEAIKLFPYLKDRFLFMTSQSTRRGGMAEFVAGTGNRLMEKPFEIEQLRDALKELLRR